MSEVEVFLDDTPGEVRGVICRDGLYEHILIDRPGDTPEWKKGARLVARVAEVWPALGGGFVEAGPGQVFVPFTKGAAPTVGAKVEIEIVAEARSDKAPTGRVIGPAQGDARLLQAGPTVVETLARLAPGVTPVTGAPAIEAGWEAVEEAAGTRDAPVVVERTRAMVTVDIDISRHAPGGAKGRAEANRAGMKEAARLIGLRRWGGLTAIDLVGAGHDGDAMLAAAKQAFGTDPRIAYGPINRFGVLMVSLPWGRTPLEDMLYRRRFDAATVADLWPAQAAIEAVRRLRHALLSDTTQPRMRVRCAPNIAGDLAPLAAELGPRAAMAVDEALGDNRHVVETP